MSADGSSGGAAAHQVIGYAIRRFRQRDGRSLEDFATAAGISYQYLCGIETGKENFSIRILEKLTRTLGVSIVTLVAVAYGEGGSGAFARKLTEEDTAA
jgi:transcriptional regulator with XRE-family HTH domain